jgi:hypothetical protein
MYSTLQCLLTATFDPHPTAGFFFLLLLLLLLFLLLLFLLLLTLRPAFQLSPLSLYQTSSRPAYLKSTRSADDGAFLLATLKALDMLSLLEMRPRGLANAHIDA